jgi:hypothetical protein
VLKADGTKYMVMSGDQNTGRSRSIKIDRSSSERVEQFMHFGTTLTNQNSIEEDSKSRLESGNACCHSAQNILSSNFVYKL